MMNDPNNQDLSEIEWEAFRFLSLEMSAGEEADFESRLASEPGLAEALSRVIVLECVVESSIKPDEAAVPLAGPSVVGAGDYLSPSMPILAVVLSIAACVVVGFVASPGPSSYWTGREIVAATEKPGDVMDSWLDVGDALPASAETENDLIALAMVDITDDGAETDGVPDWMFAAFDGDDFNEVSAGE